MTSDNAAGHNNGAVREAAENDNSSHNGHQRNRERWFLDAEPGQRQIFREVKQIVVVLVFFVILDQQRLKIVHSLPHLLQQHQHQL